MLKLLKKTFLPDERDDKRENKELIDSEVAEEAGSMEAEGSEADESEEEVTGRETAEAETEVESAENATDENEAETAETTDDNTSEEKESAESLSAKFEAWLDKAPEGSMDSEMREKALGAMASVEAALAGEEDVATFFELVRLAADYDRAVAEAEAIGEIRGRNMKIEEVMELQFDGDGVPHPGVGGNIYDAPAPGIFELARSAR